MIILASMACGPSAELLASQTQNTNPAESTSPPIITEAPIDGDPNFVSHHFVNLDNIEKISLFRSSVGHDYWDDFESCRSMKHYFLPRQDIDWTTITIYSPVDGEVIRVDEEWAGIQIQIVSEEHPQYTFILFHVDLNAGIHIGTKVAAGQPLGTHSSDQTMLDIAVRKSTPKGMKLVSFFDLITDDLFEDYQNRGVDNREDLIITREERDADALACDGEEFTNTGTLPGWFPLAP